MCLVTPMGLSPSPSPWGLSSTAVFPPPLPEVDSETVILEARSCHGGSDGLVTASVQSRSQVPRWPTRTGPLRRLGLVQGGNGLLAPRRRCKTRARVTACVYTFAFPVSRVTSAQLALAVLVLVTDVLPCVRWCPAASCVRAPHGFSDGASCFQLNFRFSVEHIFLVFLLEGH